MSKDSNQVAIRIQMLAKHQAGFDDEMFNWLYADIKHELHRLKCGGELYTKLEELKNGRRINRR